MRRSIHAIAWVLLAVSAVVLWPQRWGGAMTYVITTGNSMEPTWTAGDLAILRATDDYRVGDVAAFRSNEIKRIVMHRIISEGDAGYRFRGDNNKNVDPDVVREEQMLGKLVVRVPKVGLALSWLLKPLNLALLAGAAFLFFSDRRERVSASTPAPVSVVAAAPPPPLVSTAPLVVRITALRLPEELPTADVLDGGDLQALAQLHGLAILRDDTHDYLLQGGMLFRHNRAEVQRGRHEAPSEAVPVDPGGRRSTPQGRDWAYLPVAAAAGHPDVIDIASRRRA